MKFSLAKWEAKRRGITEAGFQYCQRHAESWHSSMVDAITRLCGIMLVKKWSLSGLESRTPNGRPVYVVVGVGEDADLLHTLLKEVIDRRLKGNDDDYQAEDADLHQPYR